MTDQARPPELVERKVGRQWLITSPDVPGLFVAHDDIDVARRAVPGAIEVLSAMADRAAKRRQDTSADPA